jgi:hypothetical protein
MCHDWKKRRYESGSEVHVHDINQKYIGIGVLMCDYDIDDEDPPMPEIKMPDGSMLLGCECWWIPVEEVKNAERKKT